MRISGEKPRIRIMHKLWHCSSRGAYGSGATPYHAYVRWLNVRIHG